MMIMFTINQIDSFRTIYNLYIGIVFCQIFSPGIFEPQKTDFKINGAFAQIHHHCRGGFIDFGAYACRNNRVDFIAVPNNVLQKIPLWLNSNRQHFPLFCFRTASQKQRDEKEEKKIFIFHIRFL